MAPPLILETDRLLLRPWRDEDQAEPQVPVVWYAIDSAPGWWDKYLV
jgi:hypothetical protein